MANIIEKNIPAAIRKRFKSAIPYGLTFFLALQYNEFFKRVFDTYLPKTDGLIGQGVILLVITIAVTLILVGLDKALDGR